MKSLVPFGSFHFIAIVKKRMLFCRCGERVGNVRFYTMFELPSDGSKLCLSCLCRLFMDSFENGKLFINVPKTTALEKDSKTDEIASNLSSDDGSEENEVWISEKQMPGAVIILADELDGISASKLNTSWQTISESHALQIKCITPKCKGYVFRMPNQGNIVTCNECNTTFCCIHGISHPEEDHPCKKPIESESDEDHVAFDVFLNEDIHRNVSIDEFETPILQRIHAGFSLYTNLTFCFFFYCAHFFVPFGYYLVSSFDSPKFLDITGTLWKFSDDNQRCLNTDQVYFLSSREFCCSFDSLSQERIERISAEFSGFLVSAACTISVALVFGFRLYFWSAYRIGERGVLKTMKFCHIVTLLVFSLLFAFWIVRFFWKENLSILRCAFEQKSSSEIIRHARFTVWLWFYIALGIISQFFLLMWVSYCSHYYAKLGRFMRFPVPFHAIADTFDFWLPPVIRETNFIRKIVVKLRRGPRYFDTAVIDSHRA